MGTFIQQLTTGLTIGSVYALIALGYNLIFGVLNVLSFAHGAIVMVGSYSTFFLLTQLGVNFYAAILAASCARPCLGLSSSASPSAPFVERSEWGVIVATIGAGLFIQFVVRRFTSGRPVPFPVPFEPTYFETLWGARISDTQLMLMGAGLIILTGLLLLIYRTKLGVAIRTVAQSPDIASCLGIDRTRTSVITFGVASAVGGASGILYSVHYGVTDVFMGVTWGSRGSSWSSSRA